MSENPEETSYKFKESVLVLVDHFDFRGATQYSIGGTSKLSQILITSVKGLVSTLELTGRVTVELKLDWIFVKPYQLTDPEDRQQSYLFAPQFGRTLKALNYSLKDRISDHNPLIVDLSFSSR